MLSRLMVSRQTSFWTYFMEWYAQQEKLQNIHVPFRHTKIRRDCVDKCSFRMALPARAEPNKALKDTLPRRGTPDSLQLATSRMSPTRAFLLGWPLLIAVWLVAVWFVHRVYVLALSPIQHEGATYLDRHWLYSLLPAMYVPTIVAFAYVNWLGWKFFRHN